MPSCAASASGWLLRDLGSRNGTRLNGVLVTAETEARPGDYVSLGPVRYRLAERSDV